MKQILLTLIALITSTPAAWAQLVGTITKMQGDATLLRNEQTTTVNTGAAIFLGDTIDTIEGSKIEITFLDKSEITIANEARLTIDEYIYDTTKGDDNKSKAAYSLKGAFHYATGLIGKLQKDPDIEITLPLASIGIRGTKIWANAIDQECRIYLEDGQAQIHNSAGSTILDHELGIRLKMLPNSPPSVPEIWKPEVVKWLKETTSF